MTSLQSSDERYTSCCQEPVLPIGDIRIGYIELVVMSLVTVKMPRLPQLNTAPGQAEAAISKHTSGRDGLGIT